MPAVQEPYTGGDAAAACYRDQRLAHWDQVARAGGRGCLSRSYQHRLAQVYQLQIPRGRRVLEIGCGTGELLAALEPVVGVGIDFSEEMLARARQSYPRLRWVQGDAHQLDFDEPFDFIILSDLVNDLWDVQGVFEKLAALARPHTRVLLNFHSRLWAAPLAVARCLGFARPNLRQNWLTPDDAANLLSLAGFEVLRCWQEVLLPAPVPVLEPLANRFLVKLPGIRALALTNFMAARPLAVERPAEADPLVSVIVPARNEAGNIPAILKRVPEFPGGTELIFVEGHSTDNTREAIEQALAEHPPRHCQFHVQTGKGKGDAVRLGFARATGDILMILDADLTVPPEDLPRFYEALVDGRGEFINGVRLVYPMEGQAMRPLNFLGNKFFSLAFSWLLGQPIKDTLCGTKVLWRRDYEVIAANRSYFGEFDPFGDFDLLFGAAKLNLRIIDLPVRYRDRTYGTTNIQRWRHGWLLLKMVLKAAGRIKFV